MEERNLDFEIPLTREQWEQVARTAARLGEEGGFTWTEQEPERIRLALRDEEARGIWEDYVSAEETYGESTREIAEIVFNDGRPHGRVKPPASAREPAVNTTEKTAMQEGLERWLREKWHILIRESGLQYDRGYIPAE